MYDPVGKLFTLRKISEIVGTWGMFIEPYLVLFLYPVTGSVITVTGKLKFLLRNCFGKVKAFFMRLAGFPLHNKWTSHEYLAFLRENGWTVQKSTVLKASFPLTYAECVKSEG